MAVQDREEIRATATISVVIFRLAEEWFALPTLRCREVTTPAPIHTLPHRSNAILLGITNVRGELLLAISLKHFLGMTDSQTPLKLPTQESAKLAPGISPIAYQRMIILANGKETWAFLVDDFYGVYRFQSDQIHPPCFHCSVYQQLHPRHDFLEYTPGKLSR